MAVHPAGVAGQRREHGGLTAIPGHTQAAAHAAGDTLQRPVHTGLGACGTVGWTVTDWPRTTGELWRAAQLAHTHAEQAPTGGTLGDR